MARTCRNEIATCRCYPSTMTKKTLNVKRTATIMRGSCLQHVQTPPTWEMLSQLSWRNNEKLLYRVATLSSLYVLAIGRTNKTNDLCRAMLIVARVHVHVNICICVIKCTNSFLAFLSPISESILNWNLPILLWFSSADIYAFQILCKLAQQHNLHNPKRDAQMMAPDKERRRILFAF